MKSELVDLFNEIAYKSSWSFTFAEQFEEIEYLHFPLIYSTKVYSEIQCYAKSILLFNSILPENFKFKPYIIDDCVVGYSKEGIRETTCNLLTYLARDTNFGREVCKMAFNSISGLANSCLYLEYNFKKNTVLLSQHIENSFQYLSRSISLNLFNVFFESYHALMKKKYNLDFMSDQNFEMSSMSNFSFLIWFEGEIEKVKSKIINGEINKMDYYNFYWNASFLQNMFRNNNISDELEYLTHQFQCDIPLDEYVFQQNISAEVPIPKHFKSLYYNNWLNSSTNSIEYIYGITKMLSTHEELRHYWQARFIRFIRLYLLDDEKIQTFSKKRIFNYINDEC